MGWKDEIAAILNTLPPRFELDDLYAFVPYLHRRFPGNRYIKEKIRQVLQQFRDKGRIAFLEDGVYAQLQAPTATRSSTLGLEVGEFTTRTELADTLGLATPDPLRRGMFKTAKGPFSNHLLLFHDENHNPYGDVVEAGKITYIGQGREGDQKLESFNRYLYDHLNLGITVHYFTQPRTEPGRVRYEGEVVVENYDVVYRAEEQRSVLQFGLVPIADPVRSVPTDVRYGEIYSTILEDIRTPGYVHRPRILRHYVKVLRDRAFRDLLLGIYENQCAVCGEPLRRNEASELQGAHIVGVAERGPDVLQNGLSLCVRHHWAFDHGVYTLTDAHKLVWLLDGEDPHEEIVNGRAIHLPTDESLVPDAFYVGHHRRKWQNAIGQLA